MTILDIDEKQLQVKSVDVTMMSSSSHGRWPPIEAPLWWYPRLHAATPEQRKAWEILPFGDAVGWDEIDEYISAKALIIGGAAPGAIPPSQRQNEFF